ncbi:MAG: DUF1127 domain-containing protein [Aestuariivirgaceae bacterium]|jgi:uncharacterized protein YjiS (DUF1127 family)
MTTYVADRAPSHSIEGFFLHAMEDLARRWRSTLMKQELLGLDDRTLEDIGLTRQDVREGRRPPRR